MKSIWIRLFVGFLLGQSASAAFAQQSVVLDYRVQPNLHQRVTTTATGDIRMKLDFAANFKPGSPAQSTVTTIATAMTQTTVITTSAPHSDGSFDMEMNHGAQRATMRTQGGPETELPASLTGLSIKGVIEKSGAVRPSTLKIEGGDPKVREAMEKTMGATLEALTTIAPLTLNPTRSTPYKLTMQVPVPGAGLMEVKVSCDMRLLDVVQNVANIDLDCTLGFDMKDASMPMSASGKGKGAMRYDTQQKMLLVNAMDLDMRVSLNSPSMNFLVDMTNKMYMTYEALPAR